MRRWARRVLALAALGGALAFSLPWAVRWLGRPERVRPRTVTPVWRVAAAFVRPGRVIRVPVPARLGELAPAGLVPMHGVLARYRPLPGRATPDWAVAPLWHLRTGVGAVPAAAVGWRQSLRSGFCLRRGCAVHAPVAPTLVSPVLRAGRSGWFTPGWDPLAVVPAAAYSDLPPQALRGAVRVASAPGQVVQAGAPVGVLGRSWSGVWLCDLPAAARGAVAEAGGARITWSKGAARVRLLAEGPTIAGRFLASFATRSGGPDPGPPQRTRVWVRLPAVRGLAVDAAAIHHGTVVALGRTGLLRMPVRVRLQARGVALVRGLPAGTRVLRRPWVAAWLA